MNRNTSQPAWSDKEGSKNEDLDRECNKIFHPEKFDPKHFNSSEKEGNIDEGAAFFYKNMFISSEGTLDPKGEDTADSVTSSPKMEPPKNKRDLFNRSASLVEAPLHDFLMNSQSQASLTNYGKSAHDQEFYAHNNPIMSKIRSKNSVPPLKRAHTEKFISVRKQSKQRKSSNNMVDKLPPIADETKPEEKRNKEEEDEKTTEKSDQLKEDIPEYRPKSPAFLIFSESEGPSIPQTETAPQIMFSGEDKIKEDTSKSEFSRKVSFHVGQDDEYFLEDYNEEFIEPAKHRSSNKKKKKHSGRHALPLDLRRTVGSELQLEDHANFEIDDEVLQMRDVENIASHRHDDWRALARHKIKRDASKHSVYQVNRGDIDVDMEAKIMQRVFGPKKDVDRSPHDLFVEMDVLRGDEWVEMARWIKYEEDREEGSERWGKAHVSSLSFHSLINLRLCLEEGNFLLDMEARDLPGVVYRVVEEFGSAASITEKDKAEILRILLYRHKYVTASNAFKFNLTRRHSNTSLKHMDYLSPYVPPTSSNQDVFASPQKWLIKSLSKTDPLRDSNLRDELQSLMSTEDIISKTTSAKILHRPISVGANLTAGFHSLTDMKLKDEEKHDVEAGDKLSDSEGSVVDVKTHHDRDGILKRLKEGTEGTIVLVGSLNNLTEPMCAFVRLEESIIMPNALEVPLPMRFVFILLTPESNINMDCYEIGRSFSTLMSNPKFHNVCYQVEEKKEILSSINQFLDESVVLPPGDWDSKNLLSIQELREIRRKRLNRLNKTKDVEEDKKTLVSASAGGDDDDPNKKKKVYSAMDRFPYPFGGLINDFKRRYPHYKSDFLDGFNFQCLAAIIFIYFAALSGAIAFGGLTGDKTNNLIGISETLIVSSVAGCIFALFAGTPLIIIGETGPVLLYDEALFEFSESNSIEFLPFRVWIGIWTLGIAIVVAAFQGSTLVKYFTKFTKDIFAGLVSLLFIYEAIRKVVVIFGKHPLQKLEVYCNTFNSTSIEDDDRQGRSLETLSTTISPIDNLLIRIEPNTALLSFILMFGTFFIAYYLRILRNGKFFGRTIRRALGDFGVPIAIAFMVLLDFNIKDTFTEKLVVPQGLQVTLPNARNWFISPTGHKSVIPLWVPFAAALPAILLYLLLFMETHICELIMMEKTSKKGNGLHWDIVLLSFINCIGAFFGGPWICAATVRAVAHVSALTVMSTTHAPGETPKIIDVIDQRLSALVVSILIGVSILFAPVLEAVPYAVLFGVFLYMGVSSTSGIQFFDRISLLLLPVKHHPPVSYVRRVKTWRMHLFTLCQTAGLVILWVVKSTSAALAFPFFVIGMIPLRYLLNFLFTEKELNALDGPKAGQIVSDDEPDFYAQGIGG